ncbi:MAG: alpha/beta fold hydrolase [Steroidobacteraceae bacterium]
MSRETLVLLPGLMCDRAVWASQIAALEGVWRCVVVDYGGADSLAAMAQLALEAAPPRFALAGHSMGGRVALEMLRSAPQRITRVALLDTGHQARPEGQAGQPEAVQRLRLLELARTQGMRVMGREWVQGMVHPERLRDAPLVESILAMIERKTPEIFAAQIRALLSRPSAEGVLRLIGCPTLIVCGRQDLWSPLTRHEEMARLVPGARLAVIENSGHMVTMERPQQVTTALQLWLAGGAPEARS